MMSQPVIAQVIDFLAASDLNTIDLTGGAPELNPYFMELVRAAWKRWVHVIDRCNLTVLEEPGQEGLDRFLAEHQVEIIASLPCYLKENVDLQRGNGVFEKSIRVLKRLNRLGYGKEGSGLLLHLVYNPLGAFLPPPQRILEEEYRKELGERYGIVFNHLYTITNMPIHRFRQMLISEGMFKNYLSLLRESHQETNLESVMCRTLLSVDWEGYLYDCDFNQMLGIPLALNHNSRIHISTLNAAELEGTSIQFWEHCYGCTAGQGSSCGGALI